MPTRLQWLDIAKGIAILLMVLGHTSIPMIVSNFIWAFHMPLFFIASGLVTNWGKLSFKQFLLCKLRSLAFPFVIYSTIVLAIECIMGENTFNNWVTNGWEGYALWFIPVLFFALLIVKALYIIKKDIHRNVLVLFILASGYLFSYFQIQLPWTISSVPYAVCMIVFGNEFKSLLFFIEKPNYLYIIFCFVVTFAISHSCKLDMCFNNILPIAPLTVGALMGTCFVFMLSSVIQRHIQPIGKMFAFVGRETFVFVAFSQIIIMLLNNYFSLNIGVKYLLLFASLLILKYLKDEVNVICKRKIL